LPRILDCPSFTPRSETSRVIKPRVGASFNPGFSLHFRLFPTAETGQYGHKKNAVCAQDHCIRFKGIDIAKHRGVAYKPENLGIDKKKHSYYG
jgi:hypothetical protein